MTKLKNFLNSKTFSILGAILLGIITWFLVLNSTNPTETRTMEVPLDVLNQRAPYEIGLNERDSDVPDKITVKATGRADILGNLSVNDFYAAIDYKQIEGPGITTLQIEEPKCSRLGVKIEDYYPKSIDVKFNKVSQRNLNVQVEYNETLLSDGFEFISVVPEPETIQIYGFDSDIEQIDCIKVFLNDSLTEKSIDSDKTGSFLGHYILKSGEDATAEYDTEKITVKIQVAKRVPLVYKITGKPDKACYYESDKISHETVLLRGSAASLRNISEINLGEISIEGATEDVEVKFDLRKYIPADVSVYQLEAVAVTANIADYETKTIEVKLGESISTPGLDQTKYNYKISPEKFKIVVKGKSADLELLSDVVLGATLDLNKSVGEYNIPLTFAGLDSEKYTVIGDYSCFVKITALENVEEIIDGENTNNENAS